VQEFALVKASRTGIPRHVQARKGGAVPLPSVYVRKPEKFAAGVVRAADCIVNLLLGSSKEIKVDVHI
jgi:hypothetical protein